MVHYLKTNRNLSVFSFFHVFFQISPSGAFKNFTGGLRFHPTVVTILKRFNCRQLFDGCLIWYLGGLVLLLLFDGDGDGGLAAVGPQHPLDGHHGLVRRRRGGGRRGTH